jgi:voltage-gated potassium channel Kch
MSAATGARRRRSHGPRRAARRLRAYFGFATLTTVGYGDIVPRTEVARGVATLEAVAGQLYLAVLVARLISLHVSRKDPGP